MASSDLHLAKHLRKVKQLILHQHSPLYGGILLKITTYRLWVIFKFFQQQQKKRQASIFNSPPALSHLPHLFSYCANHKQKFQIPKKNIYITTIWPNFCYPACGGNKIEPLMFTRVPCALPFGSQL